MIKAYREIGSSLGHDASQLKVAAHSWGWIEEDDQAAIEHYFHPTKVSTDNIGRDRPHWREMTKEQYLQAVGPEGAMLVGNPEKVAHKIINLVENLGLDRFMLHLPVGSMPHTSVLEAIRLYGEKVAPLVRQHFSQLD